MSETDIVIFRTDQNKLSNLETGLISSHQARVYEIPALDDSSQLESFLNSTFEKTPDAVLVDVTKDSAYESFIKQLRAKLADPSIPLLAILEDQLDTKTDDMLTELPIDSFIFAKWSPDRVSEKLEQMSELRKHSQRLKKELADSSEVAVTALKAAAETGLLMQLVEWLNGSTSIENAADCLFSICNKLELNAYCMLQDDAGLSFYPKDMVHETAQKVLREAQFSSIRILSKNRLMVFRCDYLVLLVTNAPWEDAERYGRLKDILMQAAMLTEGRIRTLRVNNLIKSQHSQVETIMNLIKDASSDTQNYAREIMKNLSCELQLAATSLDLTQEQEEALLKLSEAAQDSIEVLYEGSDALERHFHFLIDSITEVKTLSEVASQTSTPKSDDDQQHNEITLF